MFSEEASAIYIMTSSAQQNPEKLKEVGSVMAERTVPSVFTASETFDVGMDMGSCVALDYHEKAPFKFDGTIEKINIKYIDL